jgi:hypothetical protein
MLRDQVINYKVPSILPFKYVKGVENAVIV